MPAAPTLPSVPLWGVWFSSALSTLLPRHEHKYPELNLIISGSLAYRVQDHDEVLEAHSGQLVVLPADAHHELVRASEDLALWVLELNGVAQLPWLAEAHVFTPDVKWKKSTIAETRRLWLRPALTEALAIQGQLGNSLLSFRGSDCAPHPEPLHPAVVRAKEVCELRVHEELDIARLAQQSGLSTSRLAHLFAEQVGVTPLQYRNFARVQHFIRTYDDTKRDLLRASLRAGFGSYAQFHRVFRQVCGEPPAMHFRWLTGSGAVSAQRTLGETAEPLSA